MKTLFVSDLDGTLLNSNGKITDCTKAALNSLIERGLLFSVATARSAASCGGLLEGLNITLPLVLMNGVFLYDYANKKYIGSRRLSRELSLNIISVFERFGKQPFQYVLSDSGELCVWFTGLRLEVQRSFYRERAGLAYKTFEKREKYEDGDNTVYYAMIDTREALEPVKRELEKLRGLRCAFYEDIYSQYWYLEVFSAQASKAQGIMELKRLTGAQEVVAFGDNLNDLDMFRCADRAFAVANAVAQVRAAADGVIAANDEDGVAKYLAGAGL